MGDRADNDAIELVYREVDRDSINLGISAGLSEGMSAQMRADGTKGITGRGSQRPTSAPPKPADAGTSAKPKS
jgi:hypothetical protein